MRVMKGERLAALQDITLELTRGECPCGDCLGSGCRWCGQSGADLESLKSIRAAFAKALDVVEKAKPDAIRKLSEELRRDA